MVTVMAPAKINLTLEVLAKRGDGFHEIRSLIQTISLSDVLRFRLSREVAFKSDMADWTTEKSLVSKAVVLVQQATACCKGATIEVDKRIPLLSGLGGDSSDAAAVLKGLNRLWELDLPLERLLELAQELGSDVSFFLQGGTALMEGRGEIVTPLAPLAQRWVVLAVPPVSKLPGKTKQLYQSLGANHFTDGQITARLADEIRASKQFKPSLLFNTFENVAFSRFSGLEMARQHFIKMGAHDVHLAGSGPALFTLVEEKARAEDLYSLLLKQRMEPYLAETVDGQGSISDLY
ncbi:MAG: 4-(cytidine 5'-diphospho)-2-C-methyl-D-erythritol kinase [Dehalococcoidales bacterium]|jgi:4-diphosphocytidyl-2-C-methyl-D-erythritol kinase|nr:4-(cytidine 5'-diphospho)-2-C-methyl-D-erythritol kinase [Dehalococcoidales bacterium]